MRVVASWSGGKDSCLACYKAISQGFQVCYLANMVNEDSKKSMSHGLPVGLISAQAQAAGIALVQKETTWDRYESDFKDMLQQLKKTGVESMVFGDIDLQEHRDWVERVCAELDIMPILPLWGIAREQLLSEFLSAGFEAVIVVTKSELLGPEWLGRKLSRELIGELGKLNIDLCGENGEYHTFVTSGPLFEKRVRILNSHKVLRDGYWFFDVLSWETG